MEPESWGVGIPFIKAGQRVFLRHAPRSVGTVSRTGADGFRVTWDDPLRKPGQRRTRFSYPWHMAERFLVGSPAPDGE